MYFYLKDECLGKGSFTRIFKGYKCDTRDGEKHETQVFLKELDVIHKNCWEVGFFGLKYRRIFTSLCCRTVTLGTCCCPAFASFQSFFEAASLMSQLSHKHLLLVHGVSVHGVKSKFKQFSPHLQPVDDFFACCLFVEVLVCFINFTAPQFFPK